jgi:hypothetical protein
LPRLSYKEEEGAIHIDHMFNDWDLCEKLYTEIMSFSTGKKNFKQPLFQEKRP